MMLRLAIASALLAVFCQAALPGLDIRGSFDDVDADGNGVINSTEFNYLSFDSDGDGAVNALEFVTAMRKTGLSVEGALYFFFRLDYDDDQLFNKSEADGTFRSFDVNLDNFISFEEYSALMNLVVTDTKIALSAEPALQRMFDGAAKGDDTLTQEELWNVFAPADTDGNLLVNENEFVTFWRNNTRDSVSNSRRWFSKFTSNSSALWGTVKDKEALFKGFNSYEPEKGLTYTKFFNSMLYVFADVMEDIDNELVSTYIVQSGFDVDKSFNDVDTSGDKRISLGEMEITLKALDNNDDGILDVGEFIAGDPLYGYRANIYVFFTGDVNNDQKVDDSEIRRFFHRTDRNRDGSVSLEEYKFAINKENYQFSLAANLATKYSGMLDAADKNTDDLFTIEELGSIFAAANPDDDKTLDKKEFVDFWMKRTGLDKAISTYQFHAFDVNGNGLLGDGKESIVNFNFIDFNKDGLVSRDEFLNYMLYIQSVTMRRYEADIRASMQGKYNSTQEFGAADTNNDKNLEKAEFHALFDGMDKDDNKTLSEEEVLTAYQMLGMSREGGYFVFFILDRNRDSLVSKDEIDADFDMLDVDDNEIVSFREYEAAATQLSYLMGEASMAGFRLKYVFDEADINRDGKLTRHEWTPKTGPVTFEQFKPFWMTRVGEPSDRTRLFFDLIDADGDGYYGDDNEFTLAFDSFDSDGDNAVSKEEYLINLLKVFVTIISEQQQQS